MSDSKDPAIKLFGKTIPLPLLNSSLHRNENHHVNKNMESSGKEIENIDKKEDPTASKVTEKAKTCLTEKEISAQKSQKIEGREEENETSISQENSPKKPEKILACPRCNSLETKFCYYNNYNVNQPRHFCKKCQRYWTAGGTMRNVPVGAGRRKNKTSTTASHYRQILLSESLKTAQLQAAINGTGATSTVLNFGSSDSPLCESVLSEKQEAVSTNYPVPCFPWLYPFNSSSFIPSVYPVSFCPWNLTPLDECTYSLGKHSREGNNLNPGNPQLLPTLRIDHDPGQAATTSIWESHKKSIFDGDFQSKNSDKIYTAEKSMILQANPAALSRSLNFHESF